MEENTEERNEKLTKAIIVIAIVLVAMLAIMCIYLFGEKNCTIRFYNEEQEIGKFTYEKGKNINMPQFNNIKQGYKIVGWKAEDGKEYPASGSVKVSQDMKYYAIWEEYICEHANTKIEKNKEATCMEVGYTGDTICKDCGEILTKGEEIPAIGKHRYVASGKCKYCGEEAKNKITAEHYGDKINYTSQGCSDWKIFYNDGQNVYIIASNYVELPENWRDNNRAYVLNPLNAGWYDENIEIFDGGYSFSGGIQDVFLKNMQESSNWSMFLNADWAISAQGAPTLDMFINSWNAKGYTALYTTKNQFDQSYISTQKNGKETKVTLNTNDSLYFPYK